jgi:hypothetical protein
VDDGAVEREGEAEVTARGLLPKDGQHFLAVDPGRPAVPVADAPAEAFGADGQTAGPAAGHAGLTALAGLSG